MKWRFLHGRKQLRKRQQSAPLPAADEIGFRFESSLPPTNRRRRPLVSRADDATSGRVGNYRQAEHVFFVVPALRQSEGVSLKFRLSI